MVFDIDPRSSTPVYRQLVDSIKDAVARGILSPGDKIPTVRELASQMTLNPNTIAKAYQNLEHEGVIITMRSRGSFIADNPIPVPRDRACEKLMEMMDKMLVEAYYLGISGEELKVLLAERLDKWNSERGKA